MLNCRIFRRPCSMTKKQYNTGKVIVGMVKMSNAAPPGDSCQPSFAGITAAPNTLQIPGYGSLRDIEAEFLEFSMGILGAPQVAFSAARRRLSVQFSAVVFGRPAGAPDYHLQKSRNPARCQPTTVSGLTATKTSTHRDQTQRRII
jgi:hypothetical protein